MRKPGETHEKDREIGDINNELLGIMFFLKENYPGEAEFALLKLEAASRDLHNLRIKHLLNGKLNGL